MSLFPESLFYSIDLFVYSQDSHVFWCRRIGKVDVEKEYDFSVYVYYELMRQMNWASSLMWSQGRDKWRQKLPPANSGPQAGSCSQRSILAQLYSSPDPTPPEGRPYLFRDPFGWSPLSTSNLWGLKDQRNYKTPIIKVLFFLFTLPSWRKSTCVTKRMTKRKSDVHRMRTGVWAGSGLENKGGGERGLEVSLCLAQQLSSSGKLDKDLNQE